MNSHRPLISVIIPTFGRAGYLRQSLESLATQTLPREDFEVVVIDDASPDDTPAVCASFRERLPLKYFRLGTNSGISAAKNLGVFSATGNILFFFDDDDVADRDLLQEHLRAHRKNPEENVAVLGYTTWSPALPLTQVMNYITEIGQFLFSYPHLKDGDQLPVTYFWGGRSSCKRSLLVQHGVFNQEFRFGSEDIELGYRLRKVGLKVVYHKKAVSRMIRPITYDEFCRRCERQGYSQVHFSSLHPDPEVQKYCQVIDAEEKWEYCRRSLDARVAEVHEIESYIYSNAHGNKQERAKRMSLLPRLGDLYWWTFNAFKLKGIVDAMSARKAAEGPREKGVAVSREDVGYLQGKWASLTLPSQCAGNVLVIDPTLPWYDRAAGSLRLFHILRSLVKLGYHITYIARNPAHEEQYAPVLRQLGIEVYAGDPMALAAMGSKEISPDLDFEKVITARSYDVVILSFWSVADYYMPLVRKFSPASRVIIDTVDIHFVRELREAELKKDAREKEAALARRARELAVYKQADRLWVVTDKDRKSIEGHVGSIPFDIIPTIHPRVNEQKVYEGSSGLLFVGNFNHRPNRDAIAFFCKEIWPRVRQKLPEITLEVVGNDPPDEVRALASGHIVVRGYVPDLTPYLRQARISVVPLRYGAGIKGKIGESLSWGLPVVCSPIAAEGMSLEHGRDALIAEAPEKFAAEVVRLYTDAALWTTLSRNGRIKVQQEWSPEVIGDRLEVVMHDVAPSKASRMSSIIILTHNQWKYTRECLQSIREHTNPRHEIILIDNASTDGTIAGLEEFDGVRLIRNEENVGFPAGVNQGVEASSGDYVVLLNNDTVVTEGWLERLIGAAESDVSIGLVGPTSNSVSGPQMDPGASYGKVSDMHMYAAEIARRHKGELLQIPRIAFLCTLIKRRVIDRIGGLDERFTPGNFEDDDYCLRAQLAGFKTVIAKDVFIHHYGSVSFGAQGKEAYARRIETNRQVFIDKWGADPLEIWKERKEFKGRSFHYPLNKDGFVRHFERARLLIVEKELTLAIVSLKKAVASFPTSERKGYSAELADVLNLTGNVALAVNDLETAASCFTRELECSSDPSRARAGLAKVQGTAPDSGTHAEFVPGSQRSAGEPVRVDQTNGANVQRTLQRVEQLCHQGHVADAVSLLEQAVTASPGNGTLRGALAWLYIKNRMFDEASNLIQSTPAHIKKCVEWLEIAGYCVEGQGMDGVAAQCADKALEISPASVKALTLKGILAIKSGNDGEGEHFFERALKECADTALPHLHLGALLWARGDREGGFRYLDEAFELEPTDGEVGVTYYTAADSLSRLEEAEKKFRRASEKYPTHRQLKHFVVDVLVRQGKHEEAMASVEEAIASFGAEGDILPLALDIRKAVGPKHIHQPNGSHATISLCMIVKNEEQSIAKCLSSVKSLVDEIIVVDTGSTDRTKDIAGIFGARVFDFLWAEDFSAARNFSLSQAAGDWILVLDGDEVVSPVDHEKLKQLVAPGKKKRAFSFVTRNYVERTDTQDWVRNDGKYGEEAGTGWIPSVKVRLFPRDGLIQFHGAVHELVETSLAAANVEPKSCAIPIHHYGNLDVRKNRNKGENYVRLGRIKLAEAGPGDLKALSELAIQENELGNYEEALEIWLRVVQLAPRNSRAHMGVGTNYIGLGRFEDAVEPLKTAINLDPGLNEAYIRCSIALLMLGRASEAIPVMQRIAKRDPAYPYSKPMLSAVLFCSGEKAEALRLVREMRNENMTFDLFFDDLVRQLKAKNRFDDAVAVLEPLYEAQIIGRETQVLLVECYKSQALAAQEK